MQDLAAFVGFALNPVTWIIVAVALYLTRGWRAIVRVSASVAATITLGFLLHSADGYPPMQGDVAGLFFNALAALAISLTWVCIRKSATFEEAFPDEGDEEA